VRKSCFKEKKLKIKFQLLNVAGWLITDELLDLIKEAGCYQLCIPLETGSDRVLREVMHKPLKKEIIPQAVKKCQERGIFVFGAVVIGCPGENWNEILETIRFVEICNYDFLQISIATVFPKTEMYKIAKENHYLPEDFSFYNDDAYYGYALGKITTEEFTPQELMIVRSFEWDRINFGSPEKRKKFCEYRGLSDEELTELRRKGRRNLGLTMLGLTTGSRQT